MLKSEFSRFLITGCTNTLVGYIVYWTLNIWLPYGVAYTIAYVAGIFFSYWLNTRWVFKTQASLKSFLAFPSVYIVQYVCGVVILHVLVERLGVPEWFAPLIVIIGTIPVTFFMSRYIIRRSQPVTTDKLP